MAANKHSATMASIIERIGKNPAQANNYLVTQLSKIKGGVESIDAINRNKSPMETEAVHFKKVSSNAAKLKAKAEQAKNDIWEAFGTSISELQNTLDSKANLTEGNYSQEIRSAYKAMSPAGRAEEISKAIEAQDAQTVAAIIKAPPILTGFSSDDLSRYQEQYQNIAMPEYASQRDNLIHSEKAASIAINTAIQAADEYIDTDRTIEIDRLQGLSQVADGAFNNALQSED